VEGENAYQGYWRVYGRFGKLLRSTYLWLAIVLTISSRELWSLPASATASPPWVSLAVDIVPSVLGFALGGMAIMLAFSSGKFLDAIRQKGKANSYFMKMMASFFHFALVLTSAIIFAFLQKLTWLGAEVRTPLSALGFFLTVYGILLVLATVAGIWHTARIFNEVRDP
jgi:hypothetical protein